MANIRTVSKLAGVSVATVSRTFSTPEAVSETTRKKVVKAAEKAGYRPNLLARNFRAKRSFAIMVLVPNIANPFFSRVISGIESEAQTRGYSILLGNTGGRPQRNAEYAGMVHTFQADGVIQLSAYDPFSGIEASKRPPLVNICECLDAQSSPQIQLDNAGAASSVIDHFVALGHRRIGVIQGPPDSPLTRDRLAGCQRAMQAHGLNLEPTAIAEGDFSTQSGFDAIDALLSLRKRPTAIFCFNDEMAIGAIRRIKDLGYDIPVDLSIAGFDDIAVSSFSVPSLTTIQQPAETFGRRAVEILCDMINTPGSVENARSTLPFKLIIRGSTGPAGQR